MISNAKNIVVDVMTTGTHDYGLAKFTTGVATFADGYRVFFNRGVRKPVGAVPIGDTLTLFSLHGTAERGRRLGASVAARRDALASHLAGEVVVAVIERTKARPERLSLLRTDGTVSNHFGRDQTRADVKKVLEWHGMTLRDDDTVTRDANAKPDRRWADPIEPTEQDIAQ